jgi:hypothetical protein
VSANSCAIADSSIAAVVAGLTLIAAGALRLIRWRVA